MSRGRGQEERALHGSGIHRRGALGGGDEGTAGRRDDEAGGRRGSGGESVTRRRSQLVEGARVSVLAGLFMQLEIHVNRLIGNGRLGEIGP